MDPQTFTGEDLDTLKVLAMRAIFADEATRETLQATGVNIVPSNFYSNIPSIADIRGSFELAEAAPYDSPRLFDRARMAGFLGEIDRYADEFTPPMDGDADHPAGFFWNNPTFSYSDAMAYYCILRHIKPKTVVEIGSGFSTLVARQALDRNGDGRLILVEPYPHDWLSAIDMELHRVPAQSLKADFFNRNLSDGDVLFIDSTHTVKAGSDCLHIYLRILPKLRATLMIHAHDIYLPFAMPRSDFDRHIYWTEQYLLLAYLLDNPRAAVLFGSRFHHDFTREALDRFMRGRFGSGGASFWFRRQGRRSAQSRTAA